MVDALGVVAEIIDGHRYDGSTRFSHSQGRSMVEWPSCSCGGFQGRPGLYGQHLVEALAAAGVRFSLADVVQDESPVVGASVRFGPVWGSYDSYCSRGSCCLGEGHLGRCRQ